MPATKITDLTAISTVNTTVDPLAIVDVSDTTQASSGTTKKITVSQIDAAIFGASGSKAIVVDNVAALKALTVSGIADGQLYITRGYYSDNDGGQGTYIYDSSSAASDNGGTVIAPTAGAGRFLLQYSGELNVKQFGAKGDGVENDTTAIQSTITAASNNAVYIPAGEYKITSSLSLTSRISIFGDGVRQSYITCVACSGFSIGSGVSFVSMEHFSIGAAVRYTVTPNSYTGISINGTVASQCTNHTYRNVFVDGFQDSFYAGSVGSSVFDNCSTIYSQHGINFTGQCLNNVVTNCRLSGVVSGSVTPPSGSYGIRAGDNTGSIEGLIINNCLIFGVDRGVWGYGAINIVASNNILDMQKEFGFLLQSSASHPSLNHIIDGNYIAFNYSGGDTGIFLYNNLPAFDSQNRGTNVINNEILSYSGGSASLSYGILVDGSAEDRNFVSGNRISGTSVYDCRINQGTKNRIAGNIWKSAGGFYTSQTVNYINNTGSIASSAYPSPAGVFTPVAVGSTTSGTGTYTTQIGTYKIVDNICYFNLRLIWTAHTGTGNMLIEGLPVAAKNVAGYISPVSVNCENLTFPASTTAIIAFVQSGQPKIEFRGSGSGTAPVAVSIDSDANIAISGFYEMS